ncbi:hypothetical protein [Alteribacter natronophilus]|uniref:hypothetical protein n=1 Tax=Alteribacter natronophilus TaxID=2583810 RepID=UPI00110E96CD|nr:hypothetical protein [Alteribacter natronophilus]TMW72777.1 hypothetical protein FGB90_00240 [Alteribacter natronophilus]
MKRIGTAAVLGFGLLFTSNSISADSSEVIDSFELEADSNSVEFSWDSSNDTEYYKVIDSNTGEKISRITDAAFSQDGLLEGETYLYTIKTFDDSDETLNQYHVEFNTVFENEDEVLVVDKIYEENKTKLIWNELEDTDSYSITLNGEFIEKVENSNYFILDNVEEEAEFQVETTVPLTQKEKNDLRKSTLEEIKEKDISGKEKAELIKEIKDNINETENLFFHSTPILPFEEVGAASFSIASPTQTTIRYRTHIENRYVNDPTSTNRQFGGDNRGFTAINGTHRTQHEVRLYWGSLNTYDTFHAHPTRRYDNSGNYIDQRTATCCGSHNVTSRSSTRINYNVDVNSSNPWLVGISPNIRWETNSSVWRNGSYSSSGRHKQFPAYGIFRSDGSGWSWIYTYSANANGKGPGSLYFWTNFSASR